MGDVEEVQEQMKADMSALKDQMASMMKAMLGMKRLIESNAAIAAATKVDPVLPSTVNLAHQLTLDMVGRGRDTLGNTNSPFLGYNRSTYPYRLPPNFMPPVVHENTDHVVPFTFEGQPPQPVGVAREEPCECAQGGIDSYPLFSH